MKVLPTPGALRRWISPPSRFGQFAADREPKPVPPYLRLVLASACWNASKMIFCFSAGMPMPVSATSKATTLCAWLRTGCVEVQPPGAAETLSCTPPRSVNLKAFDSRFLSTCCRRLESVVRLRAERWIEIDLERQLPAFPPRGGTGGATASSRLEKKISSASTVTVPDSIFDRSRMSLMRFKQVGAGAVNGAREFRSAWA